MTIELASSTMQVMAVVFMTVCLTLKALKIMETDALLVGTAMGSVLLACSGILNHNVYMASAMFTAHIVSAALLILVSREGPCRILPRLHRRNDGQQ